MNISLAQNIIQQLVSHGIQTFCICPSSRNAPFVEILTASTGLQLFQFFDERSAAFFALGRSQRNHCPTVVVTTSGTAVCELLPAVCEAYYTATPLILLTADRPQNFKNSAAPQCIEQPQIFSNFIHKEWDLEKPQELDFSSWNFATPLHINVRFDEPLLDEKPIPQIKNENLIQENYFLKKQNLKDVEFSKTPFSFKEVEKFFKHSKKPLVIVSKLPLSLTDSVESLLLKWNFPIYAEPLSQIRENPQLQHLMIKAGEDTVPQLFEKNIFADNKKTFDSSKLSPTTDSTEIDSKNICTEPKKTFDSSKPLPTIDSTEIDSKNICDGVIRIGETPVLRFWRDLNELNIPVLSISRLSFPSLKNKKNVVPLIQFLNSTPSKSIFTEPKKTFDSSTLSSTTDLEKSPSKNTSSQEQKWIHWLSQKIPPRSHIFLGNSLPLREWDLSSTRKNQQFIFSGNRGANGIDGIVSTFLGLCSLNRQNYCILGDLSLLYDLSAFWILNQLKKYQIQIIVINNFGGQIFKNKFQNPYYLNTHQLDFKHLALLWKIHYQKLTSFQDSLDQKSPSLIEIQIPPPDK